MTDETPLNLDEVFKLADLYFNKKNYMFRHLYESYNKFIDESIPEYLTKVENVFNEITINNEIHRHIFKFSNIRVSEPVDKYNNPIFPSDARKKKATYSIKIIADVEQYQEITDIISENKTYNLVDKIFTDFHILTIPLMVRSRWCYLTINKDQDKNECEYDPGGYFIVGGAEKVVISQDRMVENKPFVFKKKESSIENIVVQTTSKSYNLGSNTQIISIKLKKDGIMLIKIPAFSEEFNVCIILKSLGLIYDEDIVNLIVYNKDDIEMISLIRQSLDNCKNEEDKKINTKEEAINYLTTKINIPRKYTESDRITKIEQIRLHTINCVNGILPHVSGTIINKAYYLCYMINRLLQVQLNRREQDDRDSYINKRVDAPGDLMMDLFKSQFKKILNECKKNFEKKSRNGNNIINVISFIKPSTMEQGFKVALSIGLWNKKPGVAKSLGRLTYIQTISLLRNIDSGGGMTHGAKLTSPRHLHPSSLGMLCTCQTPEHVKVGLTKSLTIMASITVMSRVQYDFLLDYLNENVIDVEGIQNSKLKNYNIYKVFLNGDWLGVTDNFKILYDNLQKMKYSGQLDQKNISIILDHDCGELRVYCDSGRLYHPTIRVENNTSLLTLDMVNNISLNKLDKDKINDWDNFLLTYPGVIEYVDTELLPYVLIAMDQQTIIDMKKKMIHAKKIANNKPIQEITNRYDEHFYLKYTNMEIHCSLLLGEVLCNIPYSNNNQGPRKVFGFAQSKQSMGTSSTRLRKRLDISYYLYHSQRPLVFTRASKYTNLNSLPAGENCVVAIACYSGYNQEDSLIFNKTAIQRGKFICSWLKKFTSSVTKNQSNSQDDMFTKPDITKVINVKHGSYNKLNDKGYAPEETTIEYGDAIFGKISPNNELGLNNLKSYRDTSEIYKLNVPAIVDRLYIDVLDQDGYSCRSALLRSERIPVIGDKYSSRHGQKGTIGLTMNGTDMPFTKKGIIPDIILNPNAIPSRMTIGQIMECITGKVAAIKGVNVDGTPFTDFNLEDVKKELKEMGYESNGNDILYNGMTGEEIETEIFIGPTYYQRLKHNVADKIHCLTIEHMVLTKRGWLTYDKLKENKDLVLSLNKNYDLCYKKINKVLKYDFNDYLYIIENDNVKLRITEEHRLLVVIDNIIKLMKIKDIYENLNNNSLKEIYLYDKIENKKIIKDNIKIIKCDKTIKVFCLEVEETEIFYIKNDNKYCWSGNSRARGPKVSLTRQTPEGRSRDGGLRLGEMERDAIISHGAALFLNEKLIDNSDPFIIQICNKCGLWVQRLEKAENKVYPTEKDVFVCMGCKNYTDISKIKTSYAFKIFLQETNCLGVATRIETEEKKFYDTLVKN